MWNDTVRRQTESSFIAADVNNTPTLNRGTPFFFFLFFFLPPFQMSALAPLLDKIQFICLPVSLPLHPQLHWGTISSLIQCCRLTLEPLLTTRCWLRATVSRSPPQVSHLLAFFFVSSHACTPFLKDPPFLTQYFYVVQSVCPVTIYLKNVSKQREVYKKIHI